MVFPVVQVIEETGSLTCKLTEGVTAEVVDFIRLLNIILAVLCLTAFLPSVVSVQQFYYWLVGKLDKTNHTVTYD